MRFSLTCFLLPSFFSTIAAVLYGDEGYAHLDGKFYAFYSGGIGVIDPETCSIETTITLDNSGQPLQAGWSDGIYMQYFPEDDGRRRMAHDGEELKGYILINSRINRQNSLGDLVSDIYVINTEDRKVETLIETGPRIVHSYGVHNRYDAISPFSCQRLSSQILTLFLCVLS
jgi:hypothetical protein